MKNFYFYLTGHGNIKLSNSEKNILRDHLFNGAFLHVDDTVKAFACILDSGKIGEIYNIGCDESMEYSVMEVAKILIKKI